MYLYNTYIVRIMKQIYKLKWRTLYVSIYFIVSVYSFQLPKFRFVYVHSKTIVSVAIG